MKSTVKQIGVYRSRPAPVVSSFCSFPMGPLDPPPRLEAQTLLAISPGHGLVNEVIHHPKERVNPAQNRAYVGQEVAERLVGLDPSDPESRKFVLQIYSRSHQVAVTLYDVKTLNIICSRILVGFCDGSPGCYEIRRNQVEIVLPMLALGD